MTHFLAVVIPGFILAALWLVFFVAYTAATLRQLTLLRVLQWWSFRNPYRHIGEYMRRWWVIEERGWLDGYGWCLANKAMRLKETAPDKYGTFHGLFGVRLHHIKREDKGSHLHSHPWKWSTRIFAGWYKEMDILGNVHLRKAGDVVTRQAHEFHRIIEVAPEGCWTLFTTYRRINSWGFLVNDRLVPHEQYNFERFGQ